MNTKVCSRCSIEKPVNEYYVKRNRVKGDKKGKLYYASYCKRCHSDLHIKKYHNETAEEKARRQKLAKKSHLSRKYGLTIEQFFVMITEQENKCKICECEMKSPQVDHNHTTGEVRALLCKPCNMAFGMLKENPKTLRNMLSYINDYLSKN
jgi:hypothetical protein